MFEVIKIKMFGHQPVAKITDKLLYKIINREFKHNTDIVRAKIKNVNGDTPQGKSRISAAILRLANQDINALDKLIERANEDGRDVIMWAEYPRCARIAFGNIVKSVRKQIYMDDFVDYSNCLNK